MKFKNLTPSDELARIYARNLEKYGDNLGPSIDCRISRGKSRDDSESATHRREGPGLLMRVDSHDRFDDVAEFDPATGRLEEFSRSSGSAPGATVTQGHYSKLSGTVAVLYRLGGSLWLRIGDEARDLDDAAIQVRWAYSRGCSTLELLDHSALIARARYTPGLGGGRGDLTPFVDSEDWDFGLFVKNVLADEGRRARIYGGAPTP